MGNEQSPDDHPPVVDRQQSLPGLETYRAFYRREVPREQDEAHGILFHTQDGAIDINITYYKNALVQLLAHYFDQCLCPKPAELEEAVMQGRTPEEASHVFGQLYFIDLRRCLDKALDGIDARLARMAADALKEFCFETVVLTLRELDGKLHRGFRNPGHFLDIATKASSESRKERLQTKKGRPKQSGAFKTASDLELALRAAIWYWLWRGKAQKEITEEDIVKYFEHFPGLPFARPKPVSEHSNPDSSPKDRRITSRQQLSRWINRHELGSWAAIRARYGELPDWYRKDLDSLTNIPLI